MKTIIGTTDLSARSDRAVQRAAMIAAQQKARLVVLHVVDDELPARVADHQRNEAQASIEEGLASLPEATAIAASVQVVFGEHYSTIIDLAETEDASLVVIGKHRDDSLLDLFRGSTGELVMRFGTRPVLIVKQRPARAYASVLVATDFSPPSRRALEVAVSLVPDGSFQLLHAYDLPFRGLMHGGASLDRLAKKHEQQFEAMIQQQKAEFVASLPKSIPQLDWNLKYGSPEDLILNAAKELNPDLLVLGTHGRTGVGRAILGSVAEAVIGRAKCDVLAVRGW